MRHISSYQALLKHHVDLKVYVYLTTYSGVPEWVYTYKLLFLCHIFPPSAPDFQCKLSSCFQAGVLGAEDCTSLLQAQKVKVTSASTINTQSSPELNRGALVKRAQVPRLEAFRCQLLLWVYPQIPQSLSHPLGGPQFIKHLNPDCSFVNLSNFKALLLFLIFTYSIIKSKDAIRQKSKYEAHYLTSTHHSAALPARICWDYRLCSRGKARHQVAQ